MFSSSQSEVRSSYGVMRVFGLSPGQGARTMLLWGMLFALTFAFELASDAIMAIFLESVGTRALPPAFAVENALRLLSTGAYFLLVSRMSYTRLMAIMSGAYGACLAGLIVLLDQGGPASVLTLFYALERVCMNLVTLHWGVYIVDFFTVGESTRAFPLIYSAESLGTLVAGTALTLGSTGSMIHLFFAPVALIGVVIVLIAFARPLLASSQRLRVTGLPDSSATAPRHGRGSGLWRFVLSLPLVRYMALATVGLVLVRGVLRVAYSFTLQELYPSAAEMAQFMGTYKMLSGFVGFLIQAFLSARLMRYFAPTRVNLSYSLVTVLLFILLLLVPGGAALLFASSVDREFKTVLKTPFSVMVYGALPDFVRAASRMFVFGAVIPVTGFVTALGLSALVSLDMSGSAILWAGIGLSVVFVALSVLQNRAWTQALVELLSTKLAQERMLAPCSSITRLSDGRIFEVRGMRRSLGYFLLRRRYASRLFPELDRLEVGRVAQLSNQELLLRLDDLLLMVELYRHEGTRELRELLVAAMKGRRGDLLDNAMEIISSLLPPRRATIARALLQRGLDSSGVLEA